MGSLVIMLENISDTYLSTLGAVSLHFVFPCILTCRCCCDVCDVCCELGTREEGACDMYIIWCHLCLHVCCSAAASAAVCPFATKMYVNSMSTPPARQGCDANGG